MLTFWENDEMKSIQPLALIGTDGNEKSSPKCV